MTAHPPAIVLGIDSPIGLAVVRELGAHGVPVHGIGDAHAIGRASRWCGTFSERVAGPLAGWLPDVIRRSGAAALLAISEGDLVQLAAMPERIGDCRILTPRAGPLGLVLDKSATLDLAGRMGMDVPASWQPETGDDFAAVAAGLAYPVVLKWAEPSALWKTLRQHRIPFLKSEYAMDAASLLAALERYRPLGRWPLVQGYCAGHGLGQMLFMAQGRATLTFQHRRLREIPPEGGVSTWCAAEPRDRHGEQMRRSEALLRAIGWEGAAMVEYRHDPATGRYWLMEVNGRFWGSMPLARECGAYFAWETYRRAMLGESDAPPPPRDDLRARYMIPETRRLATILFGGRIADPTFRVRRAAEAASYFAGFLDRRNRYYLFDRRDLGPSIADVRNIILGQRRGKSS